MIEARDWTPVSIDPPETGLYEIKTKHGEYEMFYVRQMNGPPIWLYPGEWSENPVQYWRYKILTGQEITAKEKEDTK